MADYLKVSALPLIDVVAIADFIPIVDDPAGIPILKKATITQLAAAIQSIIYPVGLTIEYDGDANTAFPGTWQEVGAGRVTVGLDTGDPDFDTIGKTGGNKTVTLTESELPAHSHAVNDPGHSHLTQRYPTSTGGSSGFTADTSMSGTLAANSLPTASAATGISVGNAGGGQAHQNMPPFVVGRKWKRIA